MGGPNEAFLTTHWSDILSARTEDEDRRQAAVSQLLTGYWKPVYCYLRRKGKSNEDAKDLTQGFFVEVVLGRKLIQKADQAKGKFRTLLLTALDRYVTSVYRAATAKKRRPADGLLSFDAIGALNIPEPAAASTPEQAFHCAWASALLDAVLDELKNTYVQTGRAAHWEIFRGRVLDPIMAGREPTPLAELCARHGVPDEVKASNMVVTVKRRFQAILKRHVRQFVDSDEDVDAEIDELMGILANSGAG